MRISDWSSDVCSSDLRAGRPLRRRRPSAASSALRPAGCPAPRPPRRASSPDGRWRSGGPAAPFGGGIVRPRRFPPGPLSRGPVPEQDRKSTRLNPVTNAPLVCRLLLEKKHKKHNKQDTHRRQTTAKKKTNDTT